MTSLKTLRPAFIAVAEEIDRAVFKWPGWPDDPVHGAAVVAEEAGEAVQAALDIVYGGKRTKDDLLRELTHTAGTAIRMIDYLQRRG